METRLHTHEFLNRYINLCCSRRHEPYTRGLTRLVRVRGVLALSACHQRRFLSGYRKRLWKLVPFLFLDGIYLTRRDYSSSATGRAPRARGWGEPGGFWEMQSIRNVSGAARAQRSECADARTVSARGGERLDLGRKMVAGEASVRGNSEWNLSPVCRRRGWDPGDFRTPTYGRRRRRRRLALGYGGFLGMSSEDWDFSLLTPIRTPIPAQVASASRVAPEAHLALSVHLFLKKEPLGLCVCAFSFCVLVGPQCVSVTVCGGFPGGLAVKNPPVNAEDGGSIPGWERSPEEGNGFSFLAWEIPWTEKPGRLQSLRTQSQTRLSH